MLEFQQTSDQSSNPPLIALISSKFQFADAALTGCLYFLHQFMLEIDMCESPRRSKVSKILKVHLVSQLSPVLMFEGTVN